MSGASEPPAARGAPQQRGRRGSVRSRDGPSETAFPHKENAPSLPRTRGVRRVRFRSADREKLWGSKHPAGTQTALARDPAPGHAGGVRADSVKGVRLQTGNLLETGSSEREAAPGGLF